MLGRLLQLIFDLHYCGSYDFSSFGKIKIDTFNKKDVVTKQHSGEPSDLDKNHEGCGD